MKEGSGRKLWNKFQEDNNTNQMSAAEAINGSESVSSVNSSDVSSVHTSDLSASNDSESDSDEQPKKKRRMEKEDPISNRPLDIAKVCVKGVLSCVLCAHIRVAPCLC